MIEFFRAGGPFMLPIAGLGVLVLGLAVRARRHRTSLSGGAERHRDAVLFWGVIAALIGLIGQFSGHYASLSRLADASAISPRLALLGIAAALSTSLFGFGVFALAAILWFALGARSRRRRTPV